jgi:hypothetical protein
MKYKKFNQKIINDIMVFKKLGFIKILNFKN